MKTLKTIFLLLLSASSVFAQINPDDLFISGYVLDLSGQAQPNLQVCVEVDSSNINFPLDSICAITNANGWYSLTVPNGSVTGPNINFIVSMYDPCPSAPSVLSEVVNNGQGSVDTAIVNFTTCAPMLGGCGAQISTTTDIDSTGAIIYTLHGSASGGLPPYTYNWQIDGTSYTGQTVSYIPSSNQTITVCLGIQDSDGCAHTICDTIAYSNNQGCSVDITSAQDTANPYIFYVSADPTGTAPFTYQWAGNSSTTQTATYITNGNVAFWDACVTVTDATGCVATACDTLGGCDGSITVTNDTMNTILTANGTGVAPLSYAWSTGEITQSIDVSVYLPGQIICVQIWDATGCATAEICHTIENPNGCEAQISTIMQIDSTGDTLYGLEGFASGGVAPYTYLWEIDGVSYMGQTVCCIPLPSQMTLACLTITDSDGCSATACDTFGIVTDPCNALFFWSESNILGSPLPAIQFTDQSQGDVSSWFWDFGDGTTSSVQNPLHTYSSTGSYLVYLTIVTANQGCQSSIIDTILIESNTGGCDAAFSSSGPTPIGYSFSASVQSPNISYTWTIDSVFAGNGYDAFAPGLTNGVHTICLTVVDSLNGCTDTQCQDIIVGSGNCEGYIYGAVNAGSANNPLDEGVAYLITFDAITNQLTAIDSMALDSGNAYFFGPLPCGDYLVKAAATSGSAYYSDHIPTYFGNSPFWAFAETISLTQPNAQMIANINLISAANPGGPGFIGGDVTQGANKTDPGDPLEGMEVLLFDMNGTAIAYTYTDQNGAFGFSDLAWGTYQVYVEMLSVQTIPAVVEIGPNNPSEENVNIFASESLITTGISEVDFEGAISDVYPNPVVNEANVAFNLEVATQVNISILDLTGRMVATESASLSTGNNTINMNVHNLKEGYYFLNVQDAEGNFSVTRKFMRID